MPLLIDRSTSHHQRRPRAIRADDQARMEYLKELAADWRAKEQIAGDALAALNAVVDRPHTAAEFGIITNAYDRARQNADVAAYCIAHRVATYLLGESGEPS